MGYLRKSKLSDLNYVVENMRVMDRLKLYIKQDKSPEDALTLTFLAGELILTIANDEDQPMGYVEYRKMVVYGDMY